MTEHRLPVGIGDAYSLRRFIEANKDFLLEHPNIHALLGKASLRTLATPPQSEADVMFSLPEDNPSRLRFENRLAADVVIFGIGRIIADDFNELLVLSGNGYGIGAYKVLRGMYERLVTAAFIAKHPEEARPFVEDDSIKRWRLWQHAIEVAPDLKDSVSKEMIEHLEAEANRVKAQRKESICRKCGQPITQEAWTRVDLATMAKQSDYNLFSLYGACYLEPTFHSHATGYGLGARFSANDGSNSYKESSESEARQALQLAHTLSIYHLSLQSDYFKLRLDDEIHERAEAFLKIWKKD